MPKTEGAPTQVVRPVRIVCHLQGRRLGARLDWIVGVPTLAFLLVVALAGCAAHATVPATAPRASSLEIATDHGVVVGRARDRVREFLGIPYAAPPIGTLRWRAPGPAVAWAAPRDATRRGPACPQPQEGLHRDTSEDCLNLNVWVPDGSSGKLAVLVWIHGGAFYQGSGGDDLYDGAGLARRAHMIVVTINYRLGALGFLSQGTLAKEQGRDALPAFGLLDQRAALQWVQHNIAAFGGDPANVTLDGESAGAWSECAQLTMPGSRGLFARAIIQSGACSDALYFTAETANAQGDDLAAKVGCTGDDVAACLRDKSADELVAALPFRRGLLLLPGVWWGPIVDGVELPQMPLAAIGAGEFARVPLIIGTARDEGTLHTIAYDAVSPDELAWFVRTTFGDRAVAPVVARYARPTPKAALTEIVTEGIFRCNTRRVARLVAARGVPVYLYEWTHSLDGPPWVHSLGPTHGIDLFFVFGVTTEGIGPSKAEEPLVDLVMELWGNFARTGDPGHVWPRYTAERDEYFAIDLPSSVRVSLDREVCDFWDALSRRLRARSAGGLAGPTRRGRAMRTVPAAVAVFAAAAASVLSAPRSWRPTTTRARLAAGFHSSRKPRRSFCRHPSAGSRVTTSPFCRWNPTTTS